MLLHLLRSQVIVMVKHPAQHLDGIGLIPVVILHVGMPHEICEFIGDDDCLGVLEAHVEELHVVPVTLLEVQQLKGEVLDESVLPQTAVQQPLMRHYLTPISQRMDLVDRID